MPNPNGFGYFRGAERPLVVPFDLGANPAALLDNFDRGTGLGANWDASMSTGGANLFISANQLAGTSATSTDGYWLPDSFGPDVSVAMTIGVMPASGSDPLGILGRIRSPGASFDCYWAAVGLGVGSLASITLSKFIAGAQTVLGTNWTSVVAGDKIGLVCIDDLIQAWWYDSAHAIWRLAVSVRDNSVLTAGFSGVRLRGTTCRGDDFSSSTIVSAPILVPGPGIGLSSKASGLELDYFRGTEEADRPTFPPLDPAAAPVVIDTFDRPDENPLAGGWIDGVLSTDAALKIVSNQVAATSAARGSAYWANKDAIYKDVKVGITFTVRPGAADGCGVWLRVPNPGAAFPGGYFAWWISGFGFRIWRCDAGPVFTPLLAYQNPTFSDGDKLAFSAIGSQLTVSEFHGGVWTDVSTISDATYAAGYIGIFGGGETTYRLDDFAVVGTPITSPVLKGAPPRFLVGASSFAVSQVAALALEALAGIAATAADPLEAQQPIAQIGTEPLEALHPVSGPGSPSPVEAGQGVARTASDPVEALGGLKQTASEPAESQQQVSGTASEPAEALQGVHRVGSPEPVEASGVVVASASGPLEALQALVRSGSAPLEALGRLAATGTLPLEALRALAVTVVLPAEVLAAIARSGLLPFEAVGGLAASGVLPAEALAAAAATAALPAEGIGGIARPGLLPYEALAGLAATGSLPAEALRVLAATGILPTEALGRLAAAASEPVEAGQGIAASSLTPLETLATLAASAAVAVESLIALAATRVVPAEALGGVAASASGPLEELAGVSAASGMPLEALRALVALGVLALEQLQGLSATGVLPLEWLGATGTGVTQTATIPIETLRPVSASGSAFAEALRPVAATGSVPAEAGQGIAEAASAAVEALARAARQAGLPLEALAAVGELVVVPVETLAGVAAVAVLPFEVVSGTLIPGVTSGYVIAAAVSEGFVELVAVSEGRVVPSAVTEGVAVTEVESEGEAVPTHAATGYAKRSGT